MYLPRRRSGPRLGLLVGLVICCLFGLGGGSAVAQTVMITGGPEGPTNDPTPTFQFHSVDNSNPQFECRVVPVPPDSTPFVGCGTPICQMPSDCTGEYMPTISADGPYTFEVRDVESGQGPVAQRGFTLDRVAPQTQITSVPSALTNDSTPTFAFSSNDPGSFECSRDGGAYTACSSPYTLDPPLGDGSHTFDVRAVD
jgi:hypothetical protein